MATKRRMNKRRGTRRRGGMSSLHLGRKLAGIRGVNYTPKMSITHDKLKKIADAVKSSVLTDKEVEDKIRNLKSLTYEELNDKRTYAGIPSDKIDKILASINRNIAHTNGKDTKYSPDEVGEMMISAAGINTNKPSNEESREEIERFKNSRGLPGNF